jgi:hypothetical protein
MGTYYTLARSAWTPTATADSALATAAGYEGYVAAAAPAVARITEVYEGGEAAASTINVMALRRDSTAAATPTAKTAAKNHPSSPANAGTWFQTASTQPTIGTAHLLNPSLNVFGGIVRWVAPPGGELYVVGGSSGNSEVSLAAVSGTPGVFSTHIVCEEQ